MISFSLQTFQSLLKLDNSEMKVNLWNDQEGGESLQNLKFKKKAKNQNISATRCP